MSKKSFNPSHEELIKYFNLRVEGSTVYFTSSIETSQAIAAEMKKAADQIERHRIIVGSQITFKSEADLDAFLKFGKVRYHLTVDMVKDYMNQFSTGKEKGDLLPPTQA